MTRLRHGQRTVLAADMFRPRRIDCRIAGSLSVEVDGEPVDIGGPKQRLLLAVLLLRANSVVRTDTLINALWAGCPPRTVRKNVQVYVSKLRKVFGDRMTHSAGGYRLQLAGEECDILRFEQLVKAGRTAAKNGDPAAGAELLRRAIGIDLLAPLPEFADVPCLADELRRLSERFLASVEDWAELAVGQGNHLDVLEELDRFVHRYPLRERLALVWLPALAAAGRTGEALAHYDFVRRTLAGELGVDPSRSLSALYQLLLRGESACAPTAPQAAGAAALRNLPRDLPDFIGREPELSQVTESLVDPYGYDVVLVSGPLGIGKTAFAVRAAHRLTPAFPDGGVLVDLGDRDGVPKSLDTVVAELAELFGIGMGNTRQRALAVWRCWVAERRLLLILDNATDEETVSALLPAGGGSRVIVTSRSRMSGLESVLRIQLSALRRADGVELLGRMIGRGRVLADLRTANHIVDYCDTPLAVRITGAKLSVQRHVRLVDYLARLAAAPSILDEMSAGELDLRSRYRHFYRGLSELQRVAMHRLVALSPPPFDYNTIVNAMSSIEHSPRPTIELFLEHNLLTVPDYEVSAHSVSYDMSAFAYTFYRETGSSRVVPQELAECGNQLRIQFPV